MILKEIENIYKYIKGRLRSTFFYCSILNPFRTMNKLKGVFIPLKRKFVIGFRKGYHPFIWCSKPTPIQIVSRDVMWKDKDDSPRYESPPYVWIYLFGFEMYWYWTTYNDSDYWEQALWYLYYYNTISYGLSEEPNLELAKQSWPWIDHYTKQSTWIDGFLVK